MWCSMLLCRKRCFLVVHACTILLLFLGILSQPAKFLVYIYIISFSVVRHHWSGTCIQLMVHMSGCIQAVCSRRHSVWLSYVCWLEYTASRSKHYPRTRLPHLPVNRLLYFSLDFGGPSTAGVQHESSKIFMCFAHILSWVFILSSQEARDSCDTKAYR